MIDANILNELANLGLGGEQLSAVIKIIAKIQKGEDERKAAHRAAQAKYRNKNRNSDITGISQANHHPSSEGSSPTPPSPNLQPIPPSPPKGGSSPTDRAIEIFSQEASRAGIPVPRKVTLDRRRKIEARLREHGEEAWGDACRRMAASSFCRGENDRGWRADLDFLCQSKSFNRLIEGGYDDRPVRQSQGPPSRKSDFRQHQEDVKHELEKFLGINRHDEFASNGPAFDLEPGNWNPH